MFTSLRDMEKLAEGIEIGRIELREEVRQEVHEEVRQEGIKIGRQEGVEIGREEGVEIGREEGVEIGREEGVEIGREEMLQERNLALVLDMLPDFDDVFIAKYSQLSIEEVARIREEHSN